MGNNIWGSDNSEICNPNDIQSNSETNSHDNLPSQIPEPEIITTQPSPRSLHLLSVTNLLPSLSLEEISMMQLTEKNDQVLQQSNQSSFILNLPNSEEFESQPKTSQGEISNSEEKNPISSNKLFSSDLRDLFTTTVRSTPVLFETKSAFQSSDTEITKNDTQYQSHPTSEIHDFFIPRRAVKQSNKRKIQRQIITRQRVSFKESPMIQYIEKTMQPISEISESSLQPSDSGDDIDKSKVVNESSAPPLSKFDVNLETTKLQNPKITPSFQVYNQTIQTKIMNSSSYGWKNLSTWAYSPGTLGPPGIYPSNFFEWMKPTKEVPDCPPGLECLASLNQVLVEQQIDVFEDTTIIETNNMHIIRNSLGQMVFSVMEETIFSMRQCCGSGRGFDIKIFDSLQTEVINLHCPVKCQSWCCPCCLKKLSVSAPPNIQIGSVEQQWSMFPSLKVKNCIGETVFLIKGPFCTTSWCCGSTVFNVISAQNGHSVGEISKNWSGGVREWLTDIDLFGVKFPEDLEVKQKALLIGACFLIDKMYYESSGSSDS